MEKEIEKKEYVAPQMTVVELSAQATLLAGSGDDCGDSEWGCDGD